MKRWTLIAMFAAATLFAGCKKKDEAGNTPAVGTGTGTGTGTAAGTTTTTTTTTTTPTTPTTPPAGDPAAAVVPPAGDPAAADPAAATGPVPSDAEVEATGAKAVKLIDSLGDAVAANAKDCNAMATGIEKVIADNQGFIQDAKKWKGNAAAEGKMEEWMKKNGVMEKVMQKMMPGMMACGQDPKVEAALKKMDL